MLYYSQLGWEGLLAVNVSTHSHMGPRSVTTDRRPIGRHRTTKANIRSHLYGGPQGWNPHFFGPERFSESPIRASESVRRISTRRLVLSAAGVVPRPDFVRVISECPVILKGIGVRLVRTAGRERPSRHIRSPCYS